MFLKLPEGYVDLDRGRWRVVAARIELAEMTALLDAVRGGASPGEDVASGRGGARRVVLRGGKVVFVRHYLRGGMVRHFVRDRFLLRPPRPIRELEATESARAAGCRVPIVHAVGVEESGPFYRGWIVTSAIEGARAYIDALLEADEAERAALLAAAGAAIRALHDAGVYHPDLNGHNLLIDADGEIAIIDFDRATLGAPGSWRLGEKGRDRFWRSLKKLTAAKGRDLDESERRWLERGYTR
ncbi:MAG TPA: lipopolysaccharide kinase InaA family protein [Candidatus Binatia bacterium]